MQPSGVKSVKSRGRRGVKHGLRARRQQLRRAPPHADRVRRREPVVRFVGGLIGFRREYKVLAAERFYDPAEIEWFGVGGAAPDWQGSKNQIGCLIKELSDGEYLPLLCLLFNAAHQSGSFVLPSSARGEWGLAVDTSRPAPADLPQIGARPVA